LGSLSYWVRFTPVADNDQVQAVVDEKAAEAAALLINQFSASGTPLP
jgi:hypothetical protein